MTAALLLAMATAASGAECLPYPIMVTVLEEGKNQRTFADGVLETNKHAAEMWVSRTGSWTITITDVNGLSCIVAKGGGLTMHNIDQKI